MRLRDISLEDLPLYEAIHCDPASQIKFAIPYGTWEIKVDGVTVAAPTLTPTDPPGPLLIPVTE